MTKEQYLEKRESINEKINSLKKELRKIYYSFIEEHKEYDINEKVILGKGTKKERFAFVSDITFFGDKIDYKFYKIKKDNSISQIADYLGWDETISKIY